MEVPVEIKVYVDVEVEKIVEVPYEVIKENIIWNEKTIDIHESKIGDYPGATVLEVIVEYKNEDKII